jgi:hypothetical protein
LRACSGREPLGLGAAIGALVIERARELPAAGATLRERWAAIARNLPSTSRRRLRRRLGPLTVCSESAAWAPKARLEQARDIEAANTSAGHTVLRSLRILALGTVPTRESTDADPAPAAAGSVRTRATASDGYRRALAAHQVAPPRRVDPSIADAVERQTAAMHLMRS